MNYWLMKTEPSVFGVDDLAKKPKQTEHWDGVRNYQVRNMIRDQMQVGDLAFMYHSSCPEPGIAGIIKIVRAAYPDTTAFDPESDHYDPKSDPDKPRWFMVNVQLVKKLQKFVSLGELRKYDELTDMPILARGNRLSIVPVTKSQWDFILSI